MSRFPGFNSRIGRFLSGEASAGDEGELKRLFCSDCEFFTPGEDEELECGCYHILRTLLDKGMVDLAGLADALRD